MGMRFRLTSVALGVGAFALGGLVMSTAIPGCTVLTNDALPDDAGLFDGSADAASTACTSCIAQECTGPWAVCLTDSRCVALRGCNNPFSESQASREACFCDTADAGGPATDGGADSLAAYAAYASCNDVRTCGKCGTDCTTSCVNGASKPTTTGACGATDAGADADADDGAAADAADAGDSGDADADAAVPAPATGVDTCASCVSGKCGDPKKACALGTECAAFLGCAHACADVACVDACAKARATGKASAMELSSCTLTSCRSACGL